ncbi:MAG: OmpA family protein [Candidatus Korobacteraceae bacterium]
MKYQRRSSDRVSHERWLVSYADFVTLLFAFFVVMYASAQVDQKRAGRLSVAIESAFQQLGIFQTDPHKPATVIHKPLSGSRKTTGDPAVELSRLASEGLGQQAVNHKKEDFTAIRAELEKALSTEIKRNEVALRTEPDGLVVSLREMGFFDSGSAAMKPEAEAAFARVAQILQEHACAVRIEGHTDTVPIHTSQFASNWELSTARATELVKALIEKYGVAPERLSAAGYAEFHPVASNASPKSRQLNRRVDIVILAAPIPSPLLSDQAATPAGQELRTSHPAAIVHLPAANPSVGGKTG